MEGSSNDCCIINTLLNVSFSTKTFCEKLKIVKEGRPLPNLPNLRTKSSNRNVAYMRHFSKTHFDTTPWLTGCAKLSKLFCWPCLLFSPEKTVWTNNGFSDLNHLSSTTLKHERSQWHIESYLKLNMLSKQRIDGSVDVHPKDGVKNHNELVSENRKILKRLIDISCFLARKELSMRGHRESEDPLNIGSYLETLQLLRLYDPVLDNHLKTATVFHGTSPKIIKDVNNAVRDVLIDEIKDEIATATFISIMFDETSDIKSKSQLSTVLRMVNEDGDVCEYFVGFSDVSSGRTAEDLFAHVVNTVEEFNIGAKLVGQTYDGASVTSGHLNKLQIKVLEAYPTAHFTHCYAHILNLVLQQCLSDISECNIFFQTLGGLPDFFSKSSRRTVALEEYIKKKLPSLPTATLNFTSRLVHTVEEYRAELVEFFESILGSPNDWDSDTTVKARGFLHFLSSFNTIFLLKVFSKLFSYADVDVLYNILQIEGVDIMYCCEKVRSTVECFQSERRDGFDSLWSSAESEKENNMYEPPAKKARVGVDSYRQLFNEILDCLIQQIDDRYGSISKLKFCNLLSFDKFKSFKKQFPYELLEALKISYEPLFDFLKLKSELVVLYSSFEFQNLRIHKLGQFLASNDLKYVFKEVDKLARLILTIPSTICSFERNFSALKRILTFIRSTMGQERDSSLSLMAIENELLDHMRLKESFYNKVTNKFLSKEKRAEFEYM